MFFGRSQLSPVLVCDLAVAYQHDKAEKEQHNTRRLIQDNHMPDLTMSSKMNALFHIRKRQPQNHERYFAFTREKIRSI